MQFWTGLVLGLILGWVIEWIIDWWYWRGGSGGSAVSASYGSDLTRITGINSDYASRLQTSGVSSVATLANSSPSVVRSAIGGSDGKTIDAEAWIAEAGGLSGKAGGSPNLAASLTSGSASGAGSAGLTSLSGSGSATAGTGSSASGTASGSKSASGSKGSSSAASSGAGSAAGSSSAGKGSAGSGGSTPSGSAGSASGNARGTVTSPAGKASASTGSSASGTASGSKPASGSGSASTGGTGSAAGSSSAGKGSTGSASGSKPASGSGSGSGSTSGSGSSGTTSTTGSAGSGRGTSGSAASGSTGSGTRRDDLTKIHGVGKVFQGKFYDAGYTTWESVSKLSDAEIRRVIQPKDWQKIETDVWVEEARILAGGGATTRTAATGGGSGKGDNLTKIHGVGKVYQGKFHDAGIYLWSEVAALSDEKILAIIEPAEWQKIEPEAWKAEARQFAKEKGGDA